MCGSLFGEVIRKKLRFSSVISLNILYKGLCHSFKGGQFEIFCKYLIDSFRGGTQTTQPLIFPNSQGF